MQANWEEGFMNRIVFNAGKAYVRQLEKGQEYDLLQTVYTLAILSENFDRKSDQFYHHYKIVNVENTEEVIEGLEFVLVELNKFYPENMADRKHAMIWLRFLKEVNEDLKALPPEMLEFEDVRLAAELCEESAFTPEELAAYEKYWDLVRTEKTAMKSAMKKGRIEGRTEGRAEGRAEGRTEGRAEKTLEIALKGLEMGMSIEDMSHLTGLPKQQIEKLISNNLDS
jgi:predicted transposase/invertase (TIGR01784 family)